MEESRRYAAKRGAKDLPDEFETGGIVGMVNLDDCAEKCRSK